MQVVLGYVGLLWLVEGLDSAVFDQRLELYGIQPREQDGAVGILFAPLLHTDWTHLVSNTVPLLILGFLLGLAGLGYVLGVTAVVWLVGGLGVWLLGPDNTLHLGASVIVFGWLTCLIVRGFVSRHPGQVAIGVLVLILYGGALWGVLPGQPGVSWQGHLFGAVGGILAAVMLTDRHRPSRRALR
jgi:membrane associated rhomboid family serine protease